MDWNFWVVDVIIDEHVFDLNGNNWDNTGAKWAYPFSERYVPHNWIPVQSTGNYSDQTGST